MPFVWDPNKRSKRARHQKHPIVCSSRFNKPIQIFIMCTMELSHRPTVEELKIMEKTSRPSETEREPEYCQRKYTRNENYAKRCQQTHKTATYFICWMNCVGKMRSQIILFTSFFRLLLIWRVRFHDPCCHLFGWNSTFRFAWFNDIWR